MTVELYIRNVGGDYIKAELFKQEEILLTDSIKDLREIEKISTTYSQNFNLPASKINNEVFSHYYNSKIVGGFDGRVKVDAIIKVNGSDFRKGTIDLRKVKLKKDKPHTYEVIFMGGLPSLKEIFGDTELTALYDSGVFKNGLPSNGFIQTSDFETLWDPSNWTNLQKYVNGTLTSITNNLSAETSTVEDFDNLKLPDFIIPNISHKAYYWHSNTGSITMNPDLKPQPIFDLNNSYDDGKHGLNIGDFRPGVKVTKVIEAIEEYGNIEFSNDFFGTDNRVLDDLYLHMNNKNGRLLETVGTVLFPVFTDDATLRIHDAPTASYELQEFPLNTGPVAVQEYIIEYKMTKTGGGAFVDNNEITCTPIVSQTQGGSPERGKVTNETLNLVQGNTSQTGTVTVTFIPRRGYTGNLDLSLSFGNLKDDYDVEILDITARSYNSTHFTLYVLSTFTETTILPPAIGSLDIPEQGINWTTQNIMPEIKIIDFLSGLFKMFNLVAYIEDNVYVVKTYDEYINSGDTLDYTNYLDSSVASVMPTELPLDLSFKFKENDSLLYKETNKQTKHLLANYGDMLINNDNVSSIIPDTQFFARAKGKPKKVELPFTKALYSQTLDPNNSSNDYGFVSGWQVDENYSPVNLQGLLFYAHVDIADFKDTQYQQIDLSIEDTKEAFDVYTYQGDGIHEGRLLYVRPSNFSTPPTGTNTSQSLCFNTEADIAHDGEDNARSLFENFYSHSIGRFYHQQGRLIDVKFRLPANEILDLELNDRIVLKGEYYTINKMKYSLKTEVVELNLLRVEPPVNFYPSFGFDVGLPSTPVINYANASQTSLSIWSVVFSTPFDSDLDNQIAGYQIEVTISSTGALALPLVEEDTSTPWSIFGLDSATGYKVRIRAKTNGGTYSEWSNTYNLTTSAISMPPPTIAQGNLLNRTSWDATVSSFNLPSVLVEETVDWYVNGVFHINLPAGQDLVYTGVDPSQSFTVKAKTGIGGSRSPFSNEITVSSANSGPSKITVKNKLYVTTDNFIDLEVVNPAIDPDGDAITLVRFYEYNTTSPVLATSSGDFNAVGEHSVYFPALSDEYDLWCAAVDEYGLEGEMSDLFTVDFSAGASDNTPPGFLSTSLISNTTSTLTVDFYATDASGLLSYDAMSIEKDGVVLSNSTFTQGERTTFGNPGFQQGVRVTFHNLTPNTGYAFRFKATDAANNQSGFSSTYTYYTAANNPGGEE